MKCKGIVFTGILILVTARDKTSLDIFWIKDKSLADLDNLPDPDMSAQEIVDNLEIDLESFREIVEKLK